MSGMMGPCGIGDHSRCPRKYQRFYIETRKGKNVVIYLDEWRVCECPKRGCPCYVPKKNRIKTNTSRRKK